ncbi:tubulin-binding prefolding complex subunit [Pichia kluyveri]|uniref:Prefoldin subunit 3 n=1 Tax=Pichia kluyveri TaxID=36015 RepID=A0AAV5R3A9_PICKL|nr:tubulin-binding prefolding complex subunit [Pichia kluyveri]
MATDRLKTEISNPRGIPEARFIENIDDFVNPKTCTDADVTNFLNELQMRLEQYKFMEESKRGTLANLDKQIPDIENTLTMCKFLKQKYDSRNDEEDDDDELNDDNVDENGNKKFSVDYQLNDTIYATADIPIENCKSVSLWLGANVMLEYPINEAVEMLTERLSKANESRDITLEDLDFLRANITTMEVNTARVYNWDVQRRKLLKANENK